jgi:hypothetical protein
MIDRQQFDETLRSLVNRVPFVPFVVELDGGSTLTIPDRPVVFCDGAATYLTPDYRMIEFSNENVVAIRPVGEVVQ